MVSQNGASAKPTIAVDAMGGDFAPDEIVRGAVTAVHRGAKVVLAGPRDVLEPLLAREGETLPIVNAPEVIRMDDPVALALRRTGSSLWTAATMVGTGEADAVVSCGNSAAIMAVAYRAWGQQPGIDRPAFGGTLPTRHGGVFVLDIGANATVKASNLVQFAVMGDVYARVARGVERPRIALLSNGSEDTKGTKEVKEANEALRKLTDLDFIGNIEGNQVFEGVADVVVCDGFTGNVLLKGGEGVATEIFHLLQAELTSRPLWRLGALILRPAFRRVLQRIDYEEYGGVPVLGVNGVMINCHGRSKSKAVANGILLAQRVVRQRLVQRITEALHEEDVEVGRRRRRLRRALLLRQSRA